MADIIQNGPRRPPGRSRRYRLIMVGTGCLVVAALVGGVIGGVVGFHAGYRANHSDPAAVHQAVITERLHTLRSLDQEINWLRYVESQNAEGSVAPKNAAPQQLAASLVAEASVDDAFLSCMDMAALYDRLVGALPGRTVRRDRLPQYAVVLCYQFSVRTPYVPGLSAGLAPTG